MKLPVVSNWNLYKAFMDAFVGLIDADFGHVDIEAMTRIQNKWPDEETKVLQLGPLPDWAKHTPVPDHITLVEGPSVRMVTHTPGGLTKLEHALNLYFSDPGLVIPDGPPYTVVGSHGWMEPMWWGEVLPSPGDLVVDIEVSGDISKDEPHQTELLSVAILFADQPDNPIFVWHKAALRNDKLREVLKALLRNAGELTAHNGKFDFRWLTYHLDMILYCTDDTMLLHYVMFPGAGEHGLKQLAARIFGAPDWDSPTKEYTRGKAHFERIPQHILVKYNAEDVYWTYHLKTTLLKRISGEQYKLYKFLMRLSHMFQDIEAAGMPVDEKYAAGLDSYFRPVINETLLKLQDLAWEGFNPGSWQQVQKWFKNYGITTKSTDEKAINSIRRMVDDGDVLDFCNLLITYRKNKKALGTYVEGPLRKLQPDKRVHPVFLLQGTVTGRTSCSRPNIQNVTNDDDKEEGLPSLRRMYAAPEGFVFVGADYSQAELRVMAEESNDRQMIYDLREGAPDYFENLLPSVYPSVDFSKLDKKIIKQQFRLPLKRVVYGMAYGRRARAIAEQLNDEGVPTTVDFAQSVIDNYLATYPSLFEWREWVQKEVLSGELKTRFGRRFQQDYIPESSEVKVGNAALAFIPQSTASDICLTAALELKEVIHSDVRLVATVHDAIYAIAPAGKIAEHTLSQMTTIMRETATGFYNRVPFLTDGKISQFWNEC